MSLDLLSKFDRRVRVGPVGCERGSVIGRTHFVALRADVFYEVVAGAMSIDAAVCSSAKDDA